MQGLPNGSVITAPPCPRNQDNILHSFSFTHRPWQAIWYNFSQTPASVSFPLPEFVFFSKNTLSFLRDFWLPERFNLPQSADLSKETGDMMSAAGYFRLTLPKNIGTKIFTCLGQDMPETGSCGRRISTRMKYHPITTLLSFELKYSANIHDSIFLSP